MDEFADLHSPPPTLTSLDQAQQVVNDLWPLRGEVIALRREMAEVGALRQQLEEVAALREELAQVKEQANLSSRNSSLAPSQNRPGQGKDNRPRKPPKKRKRREDGHERKPGGQPGHPGHFRAPVAPNDVDVQPCPAPTQCGCGAPLCQGQVIERHQVVDLPPVEVTVTEYQRYATICPGCGQCHEGQFPAQMPRTTFGAGVRAEVGFLTGSYHLSHRQVQEWLADRYGLELALGSVANLQEAVAGALAAPVAQVYEALRGSEVVYTDETRRRYKGEWRTLWTVVGDELVGFWTRVTASQESAKAVLGEDFEGFIVSDRSNAYTWTDEARHQLCWSHLLRDFIRLSERAGKAGKIGRRLLAVALMVFRLVRRRGRMPVNAFRRRMEQLQERLHRALVSGTQVDNGNTVRVCKRLLKVETCLWVFVEHPQVAATNNAAERALRAFVLWRKNSFHTWSKRGDEFVERVLTVIQSCRMQGRSGLAFLRSAIEAAIRGDPPPSLLPQH